MSYPEQQMQNFIEAGLSEADRCYTRIAELEKKNAEINDARNILDKIVSENINRRAEVEQILLNVATGKSETLSQLDCRILALMLQTPKKKWSDMIKNHVFGNVETLQ